jgi:hypothetical protein
MKDENLMEYIDTRDGFLDLYRSVIGYKKREKITLEEYHYIYEAIEFARKALEILEKSEEREDTAKDKCSIHKRLKELLDMGKYFSKDDRVVYKPGAAEKNRKNTEEIQEFFNLKDYFIKRGYAMAYSLNEKDSITMSEYATLNKYLELGKLILKQSFPLTKGRPGKKILEERIMMIWAYAEVKRTRNSFCKRKNVVLDDAWLEG